MAEFLLIHGAWHGAWCWSRTVEALAERGHRAIAVDLPGHGADQTPMDTVTVESYAERIDKAAKQFGMPPILVGHSMGGIAITAAAEAFPERFSGLVYLTAFLPRDGESLLMLEGRNPRPTVPPALVINEGEPTATIREDLVIPLFFHDCSPADQAWAKSQLTPQPLAPLSTPVKTSIERFGSLPLGYIECTDDRAISIELQRDMIAASGVSRVLSLAASHSPFLSMPGQLADCLVKLA